MATPSPQRPGPASLYGRFPQCGGHANVLFHQSPLLSPDPSSCISFQHGHPTNTSVEYGVPTAVSGNSYTLAFPSRGRSEAMAVSPPQSYDCSPDTAMIPPAGGGSFAVNEHHSVPSPYNPVTQNFALGHPAQPNVSGVSAGAPALPFLKPTERGYSAPAGCSFLRPVPASGRGPFTQQAESPATTQTVSLSNSVDPYSVPAASACASPPIHRGTCFRGQHQFSAVSCHGTAPPAEAPGCGGIPESFLCARPAGLTAAEPFSATDPRSSVDDPRPGWEASPLPSEAGLPTPFLTPQTVCGDDRPPSISSAFQIPAVHAPSDRLSETGVPARSAASVYFASPTLETPSVTASNAPAGIPALAVSPGAPRRLAQSPSPLLPPQISRELPVAPSLPPNYTSQRSQAPGYQEPAPHWALHYGGASAGGHGPREQAFAGPQQLGVSAASDASERGFSAASLWQAEGQDAARNGSPGLFQCSRLPSSGVHQITPSPTANLSQAAGACWESAASFSQNPAGPFLRQTSAHSYGLADCQDSGLLKPDERHCLDAIQRLVRQTQDLLAHSEQRAHAAAPQQLESQPKVQTSAAFAEGRQEGSYSWKDGQAGRMYSDHDAPASFWGGSQEAALTGPNNHARTSSLPTHYSAEPLPQCSIFPGLSEPAAESPPRRGPWDWVPCHEYGGQRVTESTAQQSKGDRYRFRPEDCVCESRSGETFAAEKDSGTPPLRERVRESLASVEPTGGGRRASRDCGGVQKPGGRRFRGETRSASVSSGLGSSEGTIRLSRERRDALQCVKAVASVPGCRGRASRSPPAPVFHHVVAFSSPARRAFPRVGSFILSHNAKHARQKLPHVLCPPPPVRPVPSADPPSSAYSDCGFKPTIDGDSLAFSRTLGQPELKRSAAHRSTERSVTRRENGRGASANPSEPLRRGGAPVENMGAPIASQRIQPSERGIGEACANERTAAIGKRTGPLKREECSHGFQAQRELGFSGGDSDPP
ncbi:hypothetical protein BESB_073720 [Besnoitia besnoiti]|uniref:Uncharacterized protein n=1 Tax=Besnoitia besnoiti TaxID=94643 RepID=A0A2A9MFR5_BESBE|nr:uncharacterized protein BESB_073720 [Besnoitia besnoiti]PFH34220.1 hypothetical protein BESB_073720 [Besnoitia besnoiti]